MRIAIRRIADLAKPGVSQSRGWGDLFKFVVLIVLLFWAGTSWSGCVTTAECDDVVECPDGQACYDFVCRTRCDLAGASCPAGTTCEPCQQDDPSGQIDHCPERELEAFVCLDEELG